MLLAVSDVCTLAYAWLLTAGRDSKDVAHFLHVSTVYDRFPPRAFTTKRFSACMQVNAATCVVGLLDYSTASLCLAHNVPFIYAKQDTSTDESFICSLLDRHGLGQEMPLEAYKSGYWDKHLEKLEHFGRPKPTYCYR